MAHGLIGVILSLEVSRLARSSADWHQLLDLCGLADVLIADEQSVYSPRDYNDRLLLGLKGTMSEAELYWMRLRLHGGQVSKARRGEYAFMPPAGYEWDAASSRFRMDPNENVQRAVHLVFERFRVDGAAYAVARYFARHGLTLPARHAPARALVWSQPRPSLIISMLHNPIYAGAYAWGKIERRLGLVDGQKRQRQRKLPQDEWKVCLRDSHPGYITWEEFMANNEKLQQNRTRPDVHHRGAAREGNALLQGLLLCGNCGRRMHVEYRGSTRRVVYQCRSATNTDLCYVVPSEGVDEAVAHLFLQTVQPPELELGLAVVREAERQAGEIDRQWKLRLERVQYEARLCERRYKAVDPDNRVVARALEREWNEKLEAIEELERQQAEVRRREKLELTPADRKRILALSRDLSAVWHAPTTTHAERKNMLRMLVQEVTATRVDIPRPMTRLQVLWQTGAVSDFTIERKDRYSGRSTPAEAVELIGESYQKENDKHIAAELNRRGLRTGAGLCWTPERVHRVRHSRRWFRQARKRREAVVPDRSGLYSAHAVADRVGVTSATVLKWVRDGILTPREQGSPGRPYRFELGQATLERLKREQLQRQHRRTARGKSRS